MILSPAELESLVHASHRSPHQLLGMHPLGDGSGVVVRAYLPDAAKIEVKPTLEKDKPSFSLKRIDASGLYEGTTSAAHKVFAYELVVTDYQGKVRKVRPHARDQPDARPQSQ